MKYLNGDSPRKVVIVSVEGDAQFDTLGINNLQIDTFGYSEFQFEWESNAMYIFDELSQALLNYPNVLKKLTTAFTTFAHHKKFSVVCLLQQLYGTGAVSLLRLAHSVTLQIQQGYNCEILRHFPIYKEVTKTFEHFLTRHQNSRPCFATFYFNVPHFVSPLINIVSVHMSSTCDVLMSMNGSKADIVNDEKLKDFLKDYTKENALVLIPIKNVKLDSAGNSSHKSNNTTGIETDSRTLEQQLEKAVNQLIVNTVPSKSARQFNAMWFFIRAEQSFTIYPDSLVLKFKHWEISLYEFITLLLRPSHLTGNKSQNPHLNYSSVKVAAHMLAQMMKNSSFPQTVVKNKTLLSMAQKIYKKENRA